MKEQKTVESSTTDALQFQAARALVNSPEWANKLDIFLDEYVHDNEHFSIHKWVVSKNNDFFKKWRVYDSFREKILPAIVTLLQRNPSESQLDYLILAIQERFQAIHDINRIQDTFSIPKANRVSEFKFTNNRIDQAKSLSPVIEYMEPDFDNPENFVLLLRLKEFDSAKVWLNVILSKEKLTNQEFQKVVLFMLLDGIEADLSFLEYVVIPEHLIGNFTYQDIYCFLFSNLIDLHADKATINKIWALIDHENRVHILNDAVMESDDIHTVIDYILKELPQGWQNEEKYRNLCLNAYRSALKTQKLTPELAKSFAHLLALDINLLYEALNRSIEISPYNFSQIINVFISELGVSVFHQFIYENLLDLIELGIRYDNSEFLQIIWSSVELFEHRQKEIIDLLNDNVDYISKKSKKWKDTSVPELILPKLTEEKKKDLLVKFFCQKVVNEDLAAYYVTLIDEESRNKIMEYYDELKSDFIKLPWYNYKHDEFLMLVDTLSDRKKLLTILFGKKHAEDYFESFNHILSFSEFMFTEDVNDLRKLWGSFSEDLKLKLAPRILLNSLKNLNKNAVNTISQLIYEGLSNSQISRIENELLLGLDDVLPEMLSIWMMNYATDRCLLRLNNNVISRAMNHHIATIKYAEMYSHRPGSQKSISDSRGFIYKMLDTFEKHKCLDRLIPLKVEKNLLEQWFIFPYIFQGYLQTDTSHLPVVEIKRELSRHLCEPYRSTDRTLYELFEKLIDWIDQWMRIHDEESVDKLMKFLSTLIKIDKMNRSSKLSNDEHEIFSFHLITELLSDRKNNPLLKSDYKKYKSGFFNLKNPIDGEACRSQGEKVLINLHQHLKTKYPQHFKYEKKYFSSIRGLK